MRTKLIHWERGDAKRTTRKFKNINDKITRVVCILISRTNLNFSNQLPRT